MATTLAVADIGARGPVPTHGHVRLIGVVTIASFVSYIVGQLTAGGLSMAAMAFGVSACGWAWLLARALFNPATHAPVWPRLVGLVILVFGATMVLAPTGGPVERLAGSIYSVTGSATLFLTFVEPFQGWRQDLPRTEKRFRLTFVGLYAALVGIAIVGLGTVNEASPLAMQAPLVRAICAVAGLGGALVAIWYRAGHPLRSASTPRRTTTAADILIAERLTRLMQDEALYTQSDLKVGDLASRLGEPEYRISQAIGALGFANFNRWINSLRIEQARQILMDPADTRPILHVAYDCGFGSLGPFNRAFRAQLGMTPRAFRSARNDET